MARFRKVYKKYERHFLIGLVILLLATFSIEGALSPGSGPAGGSNELGGSFQVSPTERMEISDEEYDERYARFVRFMGALRLPSREYRRFLFGGRRPDAYKGTWINTMLTEVGRHAGYKVGPQQVRNAVRDLVGLHLRALVQPCERPL